MPHLSRSVAVCCTIAVWLTGCTTPRVEVKVSQESGRTLRFVILERLRDSFRHGPATRRYEFTAPAEYTIQAKQIRGYHAHYRSTTGTWDTWNSPVGGYIALSNPQHPTWVEFRLLEKMEVPWVNQIGINGKYSVTLTTK